MRFRCTVCGYLHEGAEPPSVCPICGVGPELFEATDGAAPTPGIERDGARVVVLGAGAAGCQAAEQARATAADARIVLVNGEPGLPYVRTDLTRLLAGEVGRAQLGLCDDAWYRDQGVEALHGRARKIDRQAQELQLADGQRLGWDRLVLATGAHAFVPPITGVTRGGVQALRSLDDAQRLLAEARAGLRCVVVGGGLLGLENAGALARRGVLVTVVEGQPWLLPRQLTEPAGRLLESHLRALGIELRTAARVDAILGDEDVFAVRLAGGEEIAADRVVLSAGVRPNLELARQAGLAVGRGVRVDARMATSDERIFAAGDVAEFREQLYGIWPLALEQGRVAGICAAGGSASFESPPPATALKVLDLAVASIGEPHAEGVGVVAFEHSTGASYLRLVSRGGRLVGACLLGDIAPLGAIRRAMEAGEPVPDPRLWLKAQRPG